MSNLEIIQNKINAVERYLSILKEYTKYSEEQIEADQTLSGALERYLYLAAQATIDLAEATISHKQLRKPSTMSESFVILKEDNAISAELTKIMQKMVGFRNILAHDYEDIDFSILNDIHKEKTKDIVAFLNAIKQYLSL